MRRLSAAQTEKGQDIYFLELIVFLCGAAVMVFELVGTRVLAPYLGTSTFVWTSLIGVILGSLSIGYWTGGRLADKKLDQKGFAGILFLAAAIICITTFVKDVLLDIIVLKITGLRLGSLLASVLIFAPASILLGMVSPYAIKLRSTDSGKIGTTVGNLYAFSTVGSIIGTFLAGFYLIPQFGTNNILIVISLTLTTAAIMALPKGYIAEKILMLLLCLVFIVGGSYLAKKIEDRRIIADVDTEYSRVRISDEISLRDWKTVLRVMRLSNTVNSAISKSDDDLFIPYTKYFRLARHFRPDAQRSLLIGGGAFVYPMDFLHQFPRATMDVVEIDPRLDKLARQYFRLRDDERLKIINEDGRTFLNRNNSRYDVIFCDAFSSYFTIPFQLTTRESLIRLHSALNDDGVALVNIVSAIEGDDGRFLRAEYATFRSVFPQVYLFPVASADDGKMFQNIMLVAIKGKKVPRMTDEDPELEGYLRHLWQKEVPQDLPTLTDDYAPVDHYIGLQEA